MAIRATLPEARKYRELLDSLVVADAASMARAVGQSEAGTMTNSTPPPSDHLAKNSVGDRKVEKAQQLLMRDILHPLQTSSTTQPAGSASPTSSRHQLPSMPYRPDSGKSRSGVGVYTPREEDYVPPRPSTVGTTMRGKPYNTYHSPKTNAVLATSHTGVVLGARPPRNLPALSSSLPELSTLKELLTDQKAVLAQQQQAYTEHIAHKDALVEGIGKGSSLTNSLQRRNAKEEKQKLKASKKAANLTAATTNLRDQKQPPSLTEQFYGESARKYRAEKGLSVGGEEPYSLYDDRAYKGGNGRITKETVSSTPAAITAESPIVDVQTALRYPGKCDLKAMLGKKSAYQTLGLHVDDMKVAAENDQSSSGSDDEEDENEAAAEDLSVGRLQVEVPQLEDRPASRQLIEAYESGEAASNLRLRHFGIKESEGMVSTIFGYSPTRNRPTTHTSAASRQIVAATVATTESVVPKVSNFTVTLHHKNVLEQPTAAPSTTAVYYPSLRPPMSPEEAFDARGCPAIYTPPTLASGEEGDSPFKKPGEVSAEIILTYKSARRRQPQAIGNEEESPERVESPTIPQEPPTPPPSAGPLGHSTIDGRPRPTTSDDPFKVVDIAIVNDDAFPTVPSGGVEDKDLAAISDGEDEELLVGSKSEAQVSAVDDELPQQPVLEEHNANLSHPLPTPSLEQMQLELNKYQLEDDLKHIEGARQSLVQSREAVNSLRNVSRNRKRKAIEELANVEQQLQQIIVKAAPIYGEQRRREEAASKKADPRWTVHNKQTAAQLWEGGHEDIEKNEFANRKELVSRDKLASNEATREGYLAMRSEALQRLQTNTEVLARDSIEHAQEVHAKAVEALVKEGWMAETNSRRAIVKEELEMLRSLVSLNAADKQRTECASWIPALIQAHERYDKHILPANPLRPTTVAGGLQRPVGALDANVLAASEDAHRPYTAEDEMTRRRREHFDEAAEAYRQRIRQGWEQDRADRELLLQLQRDKLSWKQEKRKLKKEFFEACATAELLPSDVEAATANGAGDRTVEGNSSSAWARASTPASPSRPTTALTDADDALMQFTTGQSPKRVWEYSAATPAVDSPSQAPAARREEETGDAEVGTALPATPRRQEVLRLRQRLEYVQWAIDDVEQKEETLKRKIFGSSGPSLAKEPSSNAASPARN